MALDGINQDFLGGDGDPDGSGCSRTERMQQLRAEHQRRHMERNRTYPSDGAEALYDAHGNKVSCFNISYYMLKCNFR